MVVTWLRMDKKRQLHELSAHCAKPEEVYKCVRAFALMKLRSADVIGVDFGGLDLKMAFNRKTGVLVS